MISIRAVYKIPETRHVFFIVEPLDSTCDYLKESQGRKRRREYFEHILRSKDRSTPKATQPWTLRIVPVDDFLSAIEQNTPRELISSNTRHPIPDTQYTTPSTRHPVHDTQYTTPTTRHPIHDTQYTTPNTRHPVHDTQYTTPNTRHPTHDTQYTTPNTQLQQPLPLVATVPRQPS